MSTKIKYISYGKYETGGYRHEYFLANKMKEFLRKKHQSIVLEIVRNPTFYTNLIGYVKLLFLGLKANADYNIVVSRIALLALCRNLFSNKKVFIILHNFDEHDGKSIWLALYYKILFFALRNQLFKNTSIITVSKHWVHFFKQITNQKITFYLFPNFFESEKYNQVSQLTVKKHQIHLGQWSFKNHEDIFEIAKQLTKKGYYCYFSTNFRDFEKTTPYFDVKYFESFNDYLVEMASSKFTIAFTKINEGWNRVAHESILVNTPVIAYAKAGLLDLVNESNSFSVKNIEETLEIIENKNVQANPNLLAHYDVKFADEYLVKILFHSVEKTFIVCVWFGLKVFGYAQFF